MGRDENVIIFRDTEKMCNENSRLKESIRKARDGQKLILAGELCPLLTEVTDHPSHGEMKMVM